MLDKYEREISYLRMSVTDRCNLRCKYCMPEGGVDAVPREEMLTLEEYIKIADIFSEVGIRNIKLTGGEPLVRKGLPSLIKGLKDLPGIEQVTLTTNGVLLKEKMAEIWEAGIDAVNISLDTLDPEKYKRITGQDALYNVLDGINSSLDFNIKTKINSVVLKDYNFDEICDLAGMAYSKPIDVRFIEIMPIGLGGNYESCSQEKILELLTEEFGAPEVVTEKRGNGPAVYYHFKGFKGNIGFISAVSHIFCENCNKVRLTTTGQFKGCLQYQSDIDLKSALRRGDLDQVRQLISEGIFNKPQKHAFKSVSENKEEAVMSQIGG